MKKSLLYWFTFLAILLFATSCSVQKKSSETDFEQKKEVDTKTSSETNTKSEAENFTVEPIDNTKPMQFNDRFFYNTKVIYSNEKKEENKLENTDKKETEKTDFETEDTQKDTSFQLKFIHFLYTFLGIVGIKFLQKQNII